MTIVQLSMQLPIIWLKRRKMIIKTIFYMKMWCSFYLHMATEGENTKKSTYTIQSVIAVLVIGHWVLGLELTDHPI